MSAEFSFKGHAFTITTDGWDGALWIMTKDGCHYPDEMQALRDAVEGAGHIRSKSIATFSIATALLAAATSPQAATNTALTLRGPISYGAWLALSNAPAEFSIEVSNDFRTWQPLLGVTARKSSFYVVDRDAPADTNRIRFYRTRVPGLSVEEQAAKWTALRFSQYRYHFRRVCFCTPTIISGIVIVQDGSVIGVTNALDEQTGQPISNPDLAQFRSIEQLFDEIRRALLRADVVSVMYDPTLGLPARIDLDFLAPAVDDEITYEAHDFEPIK